MLRNSARLMSGRAAALPSCPPWASAANVYVSEGQNAERLSLLRLAAGPQCVHVFSDPAYNRTGFTLASRDAGRVHDSVLRLASLALQSLDLRTHDATHPRLGVVDHVSVHSLSPEGAAADRGAEEGATALALRLGHSLSAHLPVYFYGGASPTRTPLDEVRRSLGYFRDADARSSPPDLGPPAPSARSGVVCVGALPWVTNFNLVLAGTADMSAETLHQRARVVAAAVSQRRGGPAGCQSMALAHEGGTVEVACNLLSPTAPSTEEVRRLVEAAAHAQGLRILRDYCTGLTPQEIWEAALRVDALPSV